MTTLVGVDLQPVQEVESALRQFGSRYTQRLFTHVERDQCGEDPSKLAARFAAKEAVLKVLVVDQAVPAWKSIEVLEHCQGRHSILLTEEAAELAESRGVVAMTLSLDEAGGAAIATVVATTRPSGTSR